MAKVEEYLVRNLDHLDLIVEQVVALMPLSYFYKQEVSTDYFVAFRRENECLAIKSRSFAYQSDRNVERKYKSEIKRYNQELNMIGEKNRQDFKQWLLSESDELKCAVLFNLISHFKLSKYLRSFNNGL